jgi:hypothetical protein
LWVFACQQILRRNNDDIDCKYANGGGMPLKQEQHMRYAVSLSEREEPREGAYKTLNCLLASRRDASISYASGLVAREQALPWPTLKIDFDDFGPRHVKVQPLLLKGGISLES